MTESQIQDSPDVTERIDLQAVLNARSNKPSDPAAPAPVSPGADPVAPTPPADEPAPPAPADPFVSRFGKAAEEVEAELGRYKWVEEDPFIKTTLEQYRSGQPLDKIVNVLGKDWTKADDEAVIRESLSREGIADKELQDYKLRQDYGDYAPDDDSPEAKLARMSMAKKAAEARSAFVDEQKKFGQPVDHVAKQSADVEKLLSDWHGYVDGATETKALTETKRLALTVDGQTQNLEVDPTKITKLVKGYGDLLGAIGDLPLDRQYQIAAFATDPDQFMRQLVELGKTQAKADLLREERNPAPVTPPAPEGGPNLNQKDRSEWTPEDKAAFVKGATVRKR